MMCEYLEGPLKGLIIPVEAHTKANNIEYLILTLTKEQRNLLDQAGYDSGHSGGISDEEVIFYQRTPQSVTLPNLVRSDSKWFHFRSYLQFVYTNNKEASQLLSK